MKDVTLEILETDKDRIFIRMPMMYKGLLDTISGRKYDNKLNGWTVPLTWPCYVSVCNTFKEKFELGPNLLQWATEMQQNLIRPALELRDLTASEGYPNLYPHQNVDVQFLTLVKRGILASDLGSGKTRSAVASLKRLYQQGENPFPALVVCPNSTKIPWQREIEAVWPGLTVQIVRGTAAQRKKQLQTPAHIYIINWESVKSHSRLAPWGTIALKKCLECGGKDSAITPAKCHVHPRELNEIDFNTVIADECFTGDVLISTPTGKVPIKDIQTGDVVYSYDHDTESVVECRVLDTMSRDSSTIMGSISGTPNHPYYVVGEGYRQAGDLNESDKLYQLNRTHVSSVSAAKKIFQDKNMRGRDVQTKNDFKNAQTTHKGFSGYKRTAQSTKGMSILRNGVPREKEKFVLFKILCGKSKVYSGKKSLLFRPNEKELGREYVIQGESLQVFAQRQESDSYFYIGRAVANRENILVESGNWTALDQNNPMAAKLIQSSVGDSKLQARRTSSDGGWGVPSILRTRYFSLGRKDSNRSGWVGSPSEKGVRSSTYSAYREFRVVRHPVLELRNRKRYLQVLEQSALPEGKTVKVYSITTEAGNYFADDVLVRNCHKIKEPSTLMARALRAATGEAKYRFALTGTPIANTPDDLWSILNWLYPESFPGKTKFIDRYLITSVNAYGATTVLGIQEHMKKELYAIIDPITRRMPKEVILPFLPPVVYERRYVEMSPKQKKAYQQMSSRMVAEIDGTLVVTTSPLVKVLRMLQLAASYGEVEEEEYIDKESGETKIKAIVTLAEPSSKLDAFMDDIEEFEGHHVVVFTPYKQLIDLLAKRFDKAGIRYGRITGDEDGVERQYHIDNFQEGKYPFILVTTAAGGAGITLTKADIAVYLSRPWSNIDSHQSEGRIHRLGSEMHEKITYIDYITEGSVEEGIFQALDRKEENLQEILRDKEIIKKLIKDGKIN